MFLIVLSGAYAQSSNSYIILYAGEDKKHIATQADRVKTYIRKSKRAGSGGLKLQVDQSNGIEVLKVGPFQDTEHLILNFLELRQIFPQAFILDEAKVLSKQREKAGYVKESDRNVWLALFGLGLIGIIALFVSSEQIKKLKKHYNKLRKKQKMMEKRQSMLLEKMGEDIHNSASKNVVSETSLLDSLESFDTKGIKNQVEGLKKNDEDILRITYEMIDFLKIKSGNIVVKQEAFRLSKMLHKLTHELAPILKKKEYRLYYDIKDEVTRYLVGDSNRIYQVLYHLVVDIVGRKNYGEIGVYISIKDDEYIEFLVKNDALYLTDQEIDTLFIPQSWEDVYYKDKELRFYVLNELVENMDGKLAIKSEEGRGTTYKLTLPYIQDFDSKSYKEDLRKVLFQKRALVIDRDMKSANILIDILHSFDVDVLFNTSESLELYRPDLEGIDFIVLKSTDVSYKVFEFFENLDEDEAPKVIIVHDVFEKESYLEEVKAIADKILYSPLVVGDIEEALKNLYLQKARIEKDIEQDKIASFKIEESIKVEIGAFAKFKDKTILIVEDNFVSQQVLSSILASSHLHILKAENGQEALDIFDKHIPIDLIFMDLDMPVIDGFDLAQKIRHNTKYKKVPIVAVTGLGFDNEIEQMVLSGIDACIVKPYRFGQVYLALERFLDPSSYAGDFAQIHMQIEQQNKEILDISKGLSYVHGESLYIEIVTQILLALRNSHVLVRDMIVKDEIGKLKAFCVDALGLSASIGAVRYVKLLKEMLMEMKKEDVYLSQYISKYRERWLELEAEMKRILRS